MTNKACSKCGETKPISEFYRLRDAHSGRCKVCDRAYQNEYYRAPGNGERLRNRAQYRRSIDEKYVDDNRKRSRDHYGSIRGRAASLLRAAQVRAVKRKENCTITIEHVIAGIEVGICPVTGFEFTLSSDPRRDSAQDPLAPSIDRIDCNKPYSDENSRIVIWQYNRMRARLSDDEVYKFCLAVVTRRWGI